MRTLEILIIAVLVLVLALAVVYSFDNSLEESSQSFNVSATSNLTNLIDTIKTMPYFEGYDVETLNWMESLGDKAVFSGDDVIVIMDVFEAQKIPSDPGITDVFVYNHFQARVIEKHALGRNLSDVYYVDNVKFKNQEIVGNGLA